MILREYLEVLGGRAKERAIEVLGHREADLSLMSVHAGNLCPLHGMQADTPRISVEIIIGLIL